MFIETREYEKRECDLELEILLSNIKAHQSKNYDKPNYDILKEKNKRKDIEIRN